MARVDAHVITPEEYEEIPELTDEMFARMRFIRPGRPKSENPKKLITIRLTDDIIARWRASGPGWQTRMAEVLTKRAPVSKARERRASP
jgi:uncharacterized protein (DUF4415 family)